MEEALELLLSYSLVNRDDSDVAFISVHPLVHSWSSDRLDQDQLSTSASAALLALVGSQTRHYFWKAHIDACCLRALKSVVPNLSRSASQEIWTALESLADSERGPLRLALCWHALQLTLTEAEAESDWAQCLYMAHACFENAPAFPKLQVALQNANMDCVALSPGHGKVPDWIYGSKSDLVQRGLKMLRDGFQYASAQLGTDDPTTLWFLRSLATILHEQGQLDEVARYQKQILEMQTRISGPNHQDTLETLYNLAITLN